MLPKGDGAKPIMEVVQRHYPTQRSTPVVDARLEYDLRTAVKPQSKRRKADQLVKHQAQWIELSFETWARKRSNVQIAIGAVFPYTCHVLHSAKATDYVAATWLACEPMLRALLGNQLGPKRSVR